LRRALKNMSQEPQPGAGKRGDSDIRWFPEDSDTHDHAIEDVLVDVSTRQARVGSRKTRNLPLEAKTRRWPERRVGVGRYFVSHKVAFI
jgi:hypothetical protein